MNIPDQVLDQLSSLDVNNPTQPHLFIKSVSFSIAQVNAGTSLSFNQTTYDDNRIRCAIGAWASTNTAGNWFQLLSSSRLMFSSDYSMFSATFGPLPAFVPVPANVLLQVNIVNNTGSNLSAHYGTIVYAVFDPTFKL